MVSPREERRRKRRAETTPWPTRKRSSEEISPRELAQSKCRQCSKHLEATGELVPGELKACIFREEKHDGCSTDPEAGMVSRRATDRNMRSKCRCSCVLQFTFRRAVRCVLHRPPSQVIHCIVLSLSLFNSVTNFKSENEINTQSSKQGHRFNSNRRAKAHSAVYLFSLKGDGR